MRLYAHAKINWTLDILGQREDGYHLLSMVMQPISLCDILEIGPADRLSLTVEGGASDVPADERNIVMKAALLLRETCGITSGALLRLAKRIPSQAGLGGGSSDAAAALIGLNRFWNAGLSGEELAALGLRLGADVPYCLRGGLCRAEGIGEKLTSLPHAREWPLIVLQPCGGLSTGAVFKAWREAGEHTATCTDALLAAMEANDPERLPRRPGNALEPVSMAMQPAIREAVDALFAAGAVCAQMSGSGSAVFGVFRDAPERDRALARIRDRLPEAAGCKTLDSACILA